MRSLLLSFAAFMFLLPLVGCQSTETVRDEAGSAEVPPSEWEIVARLEAAPGNITVTPRGQVLFSMHQHFEPDIRVGRLEGNNTIVPFPDEELNGISGQSPLLLDSVLGIQSDEQGIVWMLDNGLRGSVTPKIVAWDTRQNDLHRVIYLPRPATVESSFVNDLAVRRDGRYIFIADPAGGDTAALIVVHLRTGLARRVLEGHRSVVPEDADMVIDRVAVEIRRADGSRFRPRVGVNPIALDHDDQWLYYGPMHGTSLYRIRTEDLQNIELTPEQLANRVERYSEKPLSDGSSVDRDGNVYITDVTSNAVGVVGTDRQYRILFRDDRMLSWPDAFSFGPDGMMYVVANQLHRGPVLNAGQNMARPPFYILRFAPLAPGVVGR